MGVMKAKIIIPVLVSLLSGCEKMEIVTSVRKKLKTNLQMETLIVQAQNIKCVFILQLSLFEGTPKIIK